MKKDYLSLAAAALLLAAALTGCGRGNEDTYPYAPELYNAATTGCHTYTDVLATKDMNTDSVVVEWRQGEGTMGVTHYNMALDCGSGDSITNTITRMGDTVTVVEHVGRQGLTNCVCLYDNSYYIRNLPQTPFTLVVKVESEWFGNSEQTIVYQQTFE